MGPDSARCDGSTVVQCDEVVDVTFDRSRPAKRSEAPLATVEAWADHLASLEIPVLRSTAEALERLRANEDDVDAHRIAEAVSNDPLMTLKILIHAASHQGRRVVTDAETVTEALVMMGISPFFRAFGPQTAVEAWLQHEGPAVLDAVRRTMNRAHRGADLALAFAVQRMDPNAATLHSVALMHEFADLLLWCHAPALQLQIGAMQHADPELRSSAAQEQVLNIGIGDLQVELARRWHLPALLAPSEAGRHIDDAKVQTIQLAARLARHLPGGWESAAVSADIAEIAELLNVSVAAAQQLSQEIWNDVESE